MTKTEWDRERPQQRLRELCAKHAIPHLDPSPLFRRSRDAALFFGDIGHFTPRGHELMARSISGFLRERELLR
jgi:lysophospholipase L1-like esterase